MLRPLLGRFKRLVSLFLSVPALPPSQPPAPTASHIATGFGTSALVIDECSSDPVAFASRFATGRRNGKVACMSTITISLPDEDLAFLRAYSQMRGTSAEAVLARQTHILREHLEQPLHPDVAAATGVILPAGDAEQEHRDHLEKKHA